MNIATLLVFSAVYTPNPHSESPFLSPKMAENTEIVIKEDDPKGPKNLFSLFPKFKLQLPFLKQEPEAASVVVAEEPRKPEEGTESKTPKPVFMSFPKAQVVAPPPVAVECEDPITKTSNPIILWQEGYYCKVKRSFYIAVD
ncbi:hypothetical protein C1H46_005329 [Malus baccata]|uniref:Uncharacterized protein n=1 Tax=Malus baccata TaxID=106549 RepID=A0A540ND38_MALBA|nr:hypothetical protein C1H46_005329 [Malus baccata]